MTPVKILILTLLILFCLSFAFLAIMGKLDRWYRWQFPADEKPTDQMIYRWRIAFAVEIVITLLIILLFAFLDWEGIGWAFFVIYIVRAVINVRWIKRE